MHHVHTEDAAIERMDEGRSKANIDPTHALREVFSIAVQPILGQTRDFQAIGNSEQKMRDAAGALNLKFAELGVGADEYKVNIEETGPSAWRLRVDTSFRERTQEEMKPIFEAGTTERAKDAVWSIKAKAHKDTGAVQER